MVWEITAVQPQDDYKSHIGVYSKSPQKSRFWRVRLVFPKGHVEGKPRVCAATPQGSNSKPETLNPKP